jgi:hypothetical protein
MGYSFMNCGVIDDFTRQQKGRMRCYLDCTLQSWRKEHQRSKPNTIVRVPKTAFRDAPGILVSWIAPLGFVDESDYVIERNPAFNISSNASVPHDWLFFVDRDYQDNSFRTSGVKYRVKKATAENWSPWTSGTVAYEAGALPPMASAPSSPTTSPDPAPSWTADSSSLAFTASSIALLCIAMIITLMAL